NRFEMAEKLEFIDLVHDCEVAETQRTYRRMYRTVLRDWDQLAELYERHGLIPIRGAPELIAENAKVAMRALNGGVRRSPAAARPPAPPRTRRKAQARGGRSAG